MRRAAGGSACGAVASRLRNESLRGPHRAILWPDPVAAVSGACAVWRGRGQVYERLEALDSDAAESNAATILAGRAPHLAMRQPQALKGLRARDFMHEMAVDVKQRRLVGGNDFVAFPDFFEQRLGHARNLWHTERTERRRVIPSRHLARAKVQPPPWRRNEPH